MPFKNHPRFRGRNPLGQQAQLSRPPPAPPPPPKPVGPPKPVPPPVSAPPPPPPSQVDWSKRLNPMGTLSEEIVRSLSLPYIPEGQVRCPDPVAYARTLRAASCPDATFNLRPNQIDGIWSFDTYGGLMGPQGVGSGKCSCKSSIVLDLHEGRRSVSELGDFKTIGINEQTGQLVSRPATSFASGEKECLRIVLKDGRTLEVSGDHPILTQRGWVRADEIKVNKLEVVAVARRLPETPGLDISDAEIRFVAALMADGNTTDSSVRFTDDNIKCIEQLETDCSALGMTTIRQASREGKCMDVFIQHALPTTRKWGIQGTKSIDKRVPSQFYLLNKSQLIEFFSSFMSGDWGIESSGLATTLGSEGLVDDFQWMLLRLGIKSRKRYKKSWYTYKGERRWKHSWRLSISGEDAITALTLFRFYGQEEKQLKVLKYLKGIKRNTNTDIVPIGRTELKEIYKELGYQGVGGDWRTRKGSPCTDLRERLGATAGQYISRKAFSEWVKESGYSGKYAWLAFTDIAWERVDKIEDIGVQPVYDLSVDEHHNYLANGIVIHNTLIAMISAVRAIHSRGHRRVCIMIPPEVYSQFTLKDLPWARERLNFHGTAVHLVKGTAQARMNAASKPGPGIWIYSYSSLSTQTGYDELMAIKATCYILDEAHNVARATSARTKRWHSVMREMEKEGIVTRELGVNPGTIARGIEVMALSGTITKKSLGDYAHIATRALGQQSPVPIREQAIKVVGSYIDAERGGGGPPGSEYVVSQREQLIIENFITWAEERGHQVRKAENGTPLLPHEQVRQSFQARFRTVPGVVATNDTGVDASLLLSWREPKRPASAEAEAMVTLMKQVVIQGQTPNGDTIDYGMHQFKWLWELSAGFYNNMIWPDMDRVRSEYVRQWDRRISEVEAEALLEKAKNHHGLLQEYHKVLRKFLERNHIPGCDTPMLVAAEIVRQQEGNKKYDLPGELVHAYLLQRAEGPDTYPDLPARYTTPVRVCDYKIRFAVEWAEEHRKTGGIIWYHHPEIGRWLAEYLTHADIPHTYAPAGENEKVFNPGLVVASYSHGTGKNLQHQCHNLFIELRREAAIMEQALGRTHRSGQQADTVKGSLLIGNGFDLAFFAGILNDADYMQSTTGQPQRLCFADYDPVVPPVSPRLMYKLGIIKNIVSSAAGAAQWEPLTPLEKAEELALFRGAAYGSSLSSKT